MQVSAFARDDGLWDLDAQITDTKTHDIVLGAAVRPAGTAIHDLKLRLTIDLSLTIIAVEAVSDAVPYPSYCDQSNALYQPLVGLCLKRDFRQQLKVRLAGTAGCTHLTELAQILPTAAIQAMAGKGEQSYQSDGAKDDVKPFQIDRCHALRSDGEVVAKFYARWATGPQPAQAHFSDPNVVSDKQAGMSSI